MHKCVRKLYGSENSGTKNSGAGKNNFLEVPYIDTFLQPFFTKEKKE